MPSNPQHRRDGLAFELFKSDISVREAFGRRGAFEALGKLTLAQWLDATSPQSLLIYRTMAERVIELLGPDNAQVMGALERSLLRVELLGRAGGHS